MTDGVYQGSCRARINRAASSLGLRLIRTATPTVSVLGHSITSTSADFSFEDCFTFGLPVHGDHGKIRT